jgi:hypothetical protein
MCGKSQMELIVQETISGPYKYEDRFAFLGVGLMDHLRSEGRLSAPDLTILHSGLWDAAKWMRDDLDAATPIAAPLTQ